MVLCKYFQTGSCRFGSKCVNEHFDVKQIVKADVEAAISGKQWPFSCFGPFKDKPSIPNFIDDQSFEEIRFLCYESKQKNYFDTFQQQFAKEALEANNKMKALLQLTPDVIDIVVNVYDAPSDVSAASVSNPGVAAKSNGSNPFGLSAPSNGANSIFSKPAAPIGIGGNAFGGSFANNVAAPNSGVGGSIFGGGNSNNNAQQNSIFSSANTVKPAGSIFGGGVGTQSSLFTQQQQQQPAPMATASGGGIFAQAAAPSAVGGGLFAQAAQQLQQPPASGGLFAQATPTSSMQPTSVFGTTQPSNIFSQQPLQLPNSGIFGQPAVQPMQPSAGGGGGGLFATAPAQTQNLFTQNQPNPVVASTNIFAQPQQQPPTGFFQQAMQQQPQPQQPVFMQQSQSPLQAQSAGSTIYSRMEDLSAEDIAAFKADCFLPGQIPLLPPPRELIN